MLLHAMTCACHAHPCHSDENCYRFWASSDTFGHLWSGSQSSAAVSPSRIRWSAKTPISMATGLVGHDKTCHAHVPAWHQRRSEAIVLHVVRRSQRTKEQPTHSVGHGMAPDERRGMLASCAASAKASDVTDVLRARGERNKEMTA